jgi:selenocysteine lyase/cysteine desulfurase
VREARHAHRSRSISATRRWHSRRVASPDVYDAVTTLIEAYRDEIAFVESATRAWDMAFYSVPFRAGDRVTTAWAECFSNYLAFLQMKARVGIENDVVGNDASGQLNLEALERAIGPRTGPAVYATTTTTLLSPYRTRRGATSRCRDHASARGFSEMRESPSR